MNESFRLDNNFETLQGIGVLDGQPVWAHVQPLILGGILARGKRTFTSALRAIGLAMERHFANTHQVINRARWHTCFASKVLLGLLVRLLPPQASFSDVIAFVRREIWAARYLADSFSQPQSLDFPPEVINQLLTSLILRVSVARLVPDGRNLLRLDRPQGAVDVGRVLC